MRSFMINRDSWHYKLNKHFFNDDNMEYHWEPNHNNFCSYWRATIGRIAFAAICAIIACTTCATLAVAIYLNPMEFAIAVALVFGVVAIPILSANFLKNRKKPKYDSLFMQRYAAYKSKICPMVTYENN